MIAPALLREWCQTVSRSLQIFPKRPQRQKSVSYGRVSQAGLEDLPCFFVTPKIDIEQGFRREVTIEQFDILMSDLKEGSGGPEEP